MRSACIVKPHEDNIPPCSEHIQYLTVRQSRLARQMQCSCSVPSSVSLSVCSLVCLIPTCKRYTSNTNKPISMQIGINLSRGNGMIGRPRGQEVKVEGYTRPKLCLAAWRRRRFLSLEIEVYSERRKCCL